MDENTTLDAQTLLLLGFASDDQAGGRCEYLPSPGDVANGFIAGRAGSAGLGGYGHEHVKEL